MINVDDKGIGFLITKTALKLKNRFNNYMKENGFNITADQFEILNILWDKEGITQTEIANFVSKDKTNITRILDVMEKNNLLQRENDKNDRRIYRIFLTKFGKMQKSKLRKVLIEGNQIISKGLSEQDLKNFQIIIDIVNKNLE
jgi:MarR family transcriptional regulator, organic hydroperoxide resistance regulator